MSIVTNILKVFVGDKSKNDIKSIQPLVEAIKKAESTLSELSADELRAKTHLFKSRIKEATADLTNQIATLHKEIESTKDIDQREVLYDQIDQLEEKIIATNEVTLEKLLPEAFAVVRETARRFKDNSTIRVNASAFDRELSATRTYIQ
ncbi:MAG: preprotein translocase subunit SecA, partial [Flavobacteriaceae bacterium]